MQQNSSDQKQPHFKPGVRELALLTLVVGLVATIVVSLAETRPTPMVLKSAASEVGLTLEQARLNAVTARSHIRVVVDTERESYQEQQRVGDRWEHSTEENFLPAGIHFLSAQTAHFDEDGMAPSYGQWTIGDAKGNVLYVGIEVRAGVSIEQMAF